MTSHLMSSTDGHGNLYFALNPEGRVVPSALQRDRSSNQNVARRLSRKIRRIRTYFETFPIVFLPVAPLNLNILTSQREAFSYASVCLFAVFTVTAVCISQFKFDLSFGFKNEKKKRLESIRFRHPERISFSLLTSGLRDVTLRRFICSDVPDSSQFTFEAH